MGKDPGALGGLSKVEMSDVTSNALALCVLSEEGVSSDDGSTFVCPLTLN